MRRGGLALMLAGLFVMAMPAPAGAHALLRASQPSDGETLSASPTEIVLEFTEEPDLDLSRIELLNTAGQPMPAGRAEKAPGEPRTLRLPVEELADGTYTVSWRVLSTVDGHVTSGAFAFGVGVTDLSGAAVPERTEVALPRPTPLAVAGRWGFYWSLALLLAGGVLALVVFGPAWRPGGALALGSWVLGAAGLLALLVAESSAADVGVADLVGSERGGVLLLRGAGLVLAGVGVVLFVLRPGRWPAVALIGATAVAMLIQAYAGHAGGATSLRWFKVGVQWVHLLAVGVWVGGLAWLLAAIRKREPAEAAAPVRRFSTLATVAIVTVVVTGGLRALDEVGLTPARYVDNGFGVAVLWKVGLFLPLAALGARNRFRNIPRLESGGLPILYRTVAGEVSLAVGIFAVTGIMAGLAPPRYAPEASRPSVEQIVATGSDFGTTVRVRLTVRPGTAGPNAFTVRVVDFDTGEPVPARQVRLRFSLPGGSEVGTSELILDRRRPGVWASRGANLSVDGRWRVGVLVEQAGDSVEVPLQIRTRLPVQDISVSEAPGQPTLYTVRLAGGISVQGYVDPGAPGANELHFTFFSAQGGEQPVDSARIIAEAGEEPPRELEIRELSPGHFVASIELDPGRWLFRVEAITPDGAPLSAYFEQRIGEEQA